MDRLLGGLFLSLPTMLIMYLVASGFSCPKDGYRVGLSCDAPTIDLQLYALAFTFMFALGAWLGGKEIIRQATASNPRCPKCKEKLPGILKPESVKELGEMVLRKVTCKNCGEEFGY